MAEKNLVNDITAREIASFLTDNPDSITDMLATHPNLLAVCLAGAHQHTEGNQQMDQKVVDLIPTLAAENIISWTRLHDASLRLLASITLTGMCQVIANEFHMIYNPNQCKLIKKQETALPNITNTGIAFHPKLGSDLVVPLAEMAALAIR